MKEYPVLISIDCDILHVCLPLSFCLDWEENSDTPDSVSLAIQTA